MKSHQALVLEERRRRVSKDGPAGNSRLARTGAPFETAAAPSPQDEVALSGHTQSRHARDRRTHSAAFGSGAARAVCEWAMALATVAIAGMAPSCIDSTAVEGTMTIVALLRFKPS
jgi:hypothetical protein